MLCHLTISTTSFQVNIDGTNNLYYFLYGIPSVMKMLLNVMRLSLRKWDSRSSLGFSLV